MKAHLFRGENRAHLSAPPPPPPAPGTFCSYVRENGSVQPYNYRAYDILIDGRHIWELRGGPYRGTIKRGIQFLEGYHQVRIPLSCVESFKKAYRNGQHNVGKAQFVVTGLDFVCCRLNHTDPLLQEYRETERKLIEIEPMLEDLVECRLEFYDEQKAEYDKLAEPLIEKLSRLQAELPIAMSQEILEALLSKENLDITFI